MSKKGTLDITAMAQATKGLSQAQIANIAIKNKNFLITQLQNKEDLVAQFQLMGLNTVKAEETATIMLNTASKGSNTIATTAQTAANTGLLASIKATTVGLMEQAAAWAMTPIGMITIAVGSISVLTSASKAYNRAIEEGNQTIKDRAKTAKEESDSISELISKYGELRAASTIDDSIRSEIKNIQKQITDLVGQQAVNLNLVNGNLDEELSKLNKINMAYTRRAREAAYSAKILAQEDFEKRPTSVGYSINPFSNLKYSDPITTALMDEGFNVNRYNTFKTLLPNDAEESLKILLEWQELFNSSQRSGKDMSDALSSLSLVINECEQKVKNYNDTQRNLVQLSMESSLEFYKLSDAQKSFIEKLLYNSKLNDEEMTKFVDSFGKDDVSKKLVNNLFDPKLAEKSAQEQRDIIIKNISLLPNEIKQALDESMNADAIAIKLGFDVDQSKIDELVSHIPGYIKSILPQVDFAASFNFAELQTLTKLTASEFDTMGTTVEEVKESLAKYGLPVQEFQYFSGLIAGLKDELTLLETVEQNFTKNLGDLSTEEYEDLTKSVEKLKDTYPDLYNAIIRYNDSKTEENANLVQSAINFYKEEELAKKLGETYKDNIATLRDLNSIYTDAQTVKTLDAQKVQEISDKYPALASSIKQTADGYIIEGNAVSDLIDKYKELTEEKIRHNKEAAANTFRNTANTNVEDTIKNISKAIDDGLITSSEQYIATLDGSVIPGLKEFIESLIAANLVSELLNDEIKIENDLLNKLNAELDNIQSAYDTVSKAIDEYNEKGLNYRSFDVNPAQGCAA